MTVVVLGAGHAGGSVVGFLRQYGFSGPIVLVGEEPSAPYQRPPLSKAWLKGDTDLESLLLKPESWYGENGTRLIMGVSATFINRAARQVVLSSGETLQYDFLVIATGARARKLVVQGSDLLGILELRTAADAEKLKSTLLPGKRLAVVGGGYIGLEAAASARALGAEVVVIEREERCLARVASKALSLFFEGYHARHGVEFVLNAEVEAFEGRAGHVCAVKLKTGASIPCDVALVGVGALPNDELARESGLACATGIVVDDEARTADRAVFAIGDVANRPLPLYERNFRLESVPNALEQAKQVACAITGRAQHMPGVPWFWSDQYDLKLQIAGIPFDCDEIVIRGERADGKFAVFHLCAGVLQAVEAVNAPAEFMGGKLLIASRHRLRADLIADTTISMKALTS